LKAKILGEKVKMARSVTLGENTVIKGKDIEIEDDVSIGNNTVISAQKIHIGFGTAIEENCKIFKVSGEITEFSVGDNCFIGHDSKIAVPVFRTGDYVSLNNHLFVNGIKPCTIGHNVWIGQNCILNSRDNLTIGNGVGIGTYSCLWTHGAHGELLEGCRIFKVAPVVLEDDVWIVGSFNVVSPGVKLGKKAVILTGSVVTKDVAPCSCVAGNPARDITDKLQPYTEISLDEKYEMMRNFMEEFASSRNATKTHDGWRITKDKSIYEIVFMECANNKTVQKDVPRVIFTKKNTVTKNLRKTTIFDLATKTYTKRRTAAEIAVIKSLLYSKARFCPQENEQTLTKAARD
jgi:acetyltransferase-like isoleucine patch superfamily enzyme